MAIEVEVNDAVEKPYRYRGGGKLAVGRHSLTQINENIGIPIGLLTVEGDDRQFAVKSWTVGLHGDSEVTVTAELSILPKPE